MRNLTPGKVYESIDKRYVNYNIFNKINNSQRYYVIPTNIDLLDTRPIKIYIAEGPFDILSVFYNLRNRDKTNCIYAAIGGKAYLNIIKYFIQRQGLVNIELHICPDGDIGKDVLYGIKDYLRLFSIPIFVHRNIYPEQKDFGVSLNKIRESVIQL